jgi:hypothetical protein
MVVAGLMMISAAWGDVSAVAGTEWGDVSAVAGTGRPGGVIAA